MKFLPDVVIYKEAQNQNKIDIAGPVCKLQTKIQRNPVFRNATSRCANLAKLCRIINIDIKNEF